MFCRSKSNVKVADSASSKEKKKCSMCSSEKNILTLACQHLLCVKCYNRTCYCIICDNAKTRSWCWCC